MKITSHSRRHWLTLVTVAGMLVSVLGPGSEVTMAKGLAQQAATGILTAAVLRTPAGIKRTLPTLSNGTQAAARSAANAAAANNDLVGMREEESDSAAGAGADVIGLADGSLGCGDRVHGQNTRVNQDCTFRRQAEESIKANPVNPKNLIAGQNDSRIGFNHCGFDYSFDGGQTWGDGLPPFYNHWNNPAPGHTILGDAGTFHTYDAASDPALAFDSKGNAYFSCVVFDVISAASGIFVAQSPAGAGGSFYNNVPTSNRYVVVEDNNLNIFHDKEFITADSNPNSPYRDRVYLTWTVFRSDCPAGFCSSAIYFSSSSDGAKTWTAPKEISGNSPTLCFFGDAFDSRRNAHDCDFDQGSDPIVRPDGSLVVVFNNGNTAANNPNSQQLAVVSHDGGATWSAPTKVGDDITLGEPLCDFGRGPEQCVPGPFIRTNDFPRIGMDKSNGNLYAVWQDYRFGELDIILSSSTNGGTTWTQATKAVNPSTGRDHYMAAVDISSNGRLVVSYYRSQIPATAAQIGALMSDYSLAVSGQRGSFRESQLTRPFPPPSGNQLGFNGDYSGLVVTGNTAHPIWSDTRNQALTGQGVVNDEDIFTDAIDVGGN